MTKQTSTSSSAAKIFITGAAGFIGAHTAAVLAQRGHTVLGVDNYNDYYDPALKTARVAALLEPLNVTCKNLDIAKPDAVLDELQAFQPDVVIHLAAQAGVRYSIKQPRAYIQSNLVGFGEILQACVQAGVDKLLYASSSSVYGKRDTAPFKETDRTDTPASLYAATKKANEAMAYAYTDIHGLDATGLRFFTVYGPWGRPDMAYFGFSEKMAKGEPITLFCEGKLLRDFTYVGDVVDAVVQLTEAKLAEEAQAGHRVFNIGHHQPVEVVELVAALEQSLGIQAKIEYAGMQAGDVPITCADDSQLRHALGGEWAHTSLRDGIAQFAAWYKQWRQLDDKKSMD